MLSRSDAAIALIKEAGLPVRLSFKRAPVSVKGLFGSVAGPSSAAGGAATTKIPSFKFGVTNTSSKGLSSSTAPTEGFKFGSGNAAPASTSPSSFSFGVRKSAEPTTDNGESPGTKKEGLGSTSEAADGDADGDAKE